MGRLLCFYLCLTLLFDYSYEQNERKFFRKDYNYIESVGNFYKIHTVPMIWVDAKQICEWEGTTLYYPRNEEEANAVQRFAIESNTDGRYWIGITSLLSEGIFLTTDGLPMTETYIQWHIHEPNNIGDSENCVEYYSGGMNDINCKNKRKFICKKTLASLEWNTACQIPYTDYMYHETLGKCYKLHTSPKTWTEAYATCSSELSYLAVIDNQDEADYLVDTLANGVVGGIHEVAHLGFHNKFKHGWRTVKDTPLQNTEYMFWNDNGALEACGGMNFNGTLTDVACEQRGFFICEHDVPMQAGTRVV